MEEKLQGKVTNRAYGSYLLYMGLFLIGIIYSPEYRWLFVAGIMACSFFFFRVREKTLMEIYDSRIAFHGEDGNTVIPSDKLESFQYVKDNTQLLQIIYRDESGETRDLLIHDFNTVRMHQLLNRYFPENNKVKEEYQRKAEENREANRAYFSRIRNKLLKPFNR